MNTETLNQMTVNLLESLDKDELLNQKGISAIVSLIKRDDSRATIRHTIKTNGGDKVHYVEGMKALISHYDTSAAISMRGLCEQSATEKVSRKFLEEKIVPLLTELGVIVRAGERSSYWQAYNKIGHKPGLLDTVLSSFAATPEKLAAKAETQRAYAEKLKLDTAKKAEAFAQRRKEALMRTVNATKEADTLTASLPGQPETLGDKVKANPAAAVLIGFLIVGIGAAMMTSEPQQQALTPLIANVNGSPTLDPRILAGE